MLRQHRASSSCIINGPKKMKKIHFSFFLENSQKLMIFDEKIELELREAEEGSSSSAPTLAMRRLLEKIICMVSFLVTNTHAAKCAFCFTIVTQGNVKLQERLGKYKRTLGPGFHWIIPFVDQARPISTKEIVLDTPPQNCITRDNGKI